MKGLNVCHNKILKIKHPIKTILLTSILDLEPTVTWLKYCQYVVKLYSINQSINRFRTMLNLRNGFTLNKYCLNIVQISLFKCLISDQNLSDLNVL